MINEQKLLLGFVSGALGAVIVDLHAYGRAPAGEAFNWRKAAARWVAGGIGGGLVGLGLPVTGLA